MVQLTPSPRINPNCHKVASLSQLHLEGQSYNRLREWPFSSENKYMMVEAQRTPTSPTQLYMKGAVEHVLMASSQYYSCNGKMLPLNDKHRHVLLQEAALMGRSGLRGEGF